MSKSFRYLDAFSSKLENKKKWKNIFFFVIGFIKKFFLYTLRYVSMKMKVNWVQNK